MMFTDSSFSVYSNAPFGFLPYFILGYQMKGEKATIENICENKACKVSFIFFLLIAMGWSLFDANQCTLYIWGGLGCFLASGIVQMLPK